MSAPHSVCIHEAGHAIVTLAAGVVVHELGANHRDGGYCKARYQDWPLIPATLAGAAAEALICGHRFEDSLSDLDADIMHRLEQQFEADTKRAVTGADRMKWRDLATQIVFVQERNIRQLAAEIDDRGVFTREALGAYAWRGGSAISEWRDLYPRPRPAGPKPAPTLSAYRDTPTKDLTITKLPPGSRWSAEHGCYLSPAGPPGKRWDPVAGRYVTDTTGPRRRSPGAVSVFQTLDLRV